MDEFQVRQQERISQQQVEQQQVEPIQLNPQQQQMREHLTTLQSWDLAPEQTIEQRRAQQTDSAMQQVFRRNANVRKDWREQCRIFQELKTAEGRPIQIQAPAKKTYKQRREDKRLDAVAKEKNAVMDHISLRMMEGLEEEKKIHENSVEDLSSAQKETIAQNKIDLNVLKAFSFGYKKDEKGRPEDAKLKELDQNFLDDYISGDLNRRRSHLNRMVSQVLGLDFTEEMFKPEYMEYHAGELREKINRLVYFEKVSKDPINKPYFDELPQHTKDLIKYRVTDRCAQVGAFFTMVCARHGVDCNNVKHLDHSAEYIRNMYMSTEGLDAMQEEMREALTTTRQQEREMLQRSFDQMYREKEAELLEISDANKQETDLEHLRNDKGADMSNLGLTAYYHFNSMSDLADCRRLIEDSPEQYQRHAAIIDALYQQTYRSMDALGDLRLVKATTNAIYNDVQDPQLTEDAYVSVLIDKIDILQNEVEAKRPALKLHISEMMEAMKQLLTGRKLSKSSKKVIEQLGFRV